MQSKKIIIAAIAVAVLSTQCCSYHTHKKSALAMAILAWDRNTTLPQAIETARTMTGTRSISAAVILSDGTVISSAANSPGGTNPVTEDTRFSIGSCTKTFIAACAFNLIEAGTLSLDDTLQKLLYDTGTIDASYADKISPGIRIRDLLNHTTGVADYLESTSYFTAIYAAPTQKWDYRKTLAYVGSPVYTYNAANRSNNTFDYSNTNFILLGIIIEQVSGKKILAYLTENYLTLLGLDSTYMAGVDPYWGLASIPGQMAIGYEKNLLGQWVRSSTLISEDAVAVYTSTWTCGSMVSTARDMAKWIKYYYQLQHGRGYLADGLLKQSTISSRYFSERKFGYGIEYVRHKDGTELWGHTGTIIGFNSLVFYLPKKDISVAILINDHRSDRWTILHCVLEYINAIQSTVE